ncbi:hypothetical protein LBMAG48_18210 [Phycisphaerae bacterium]|jgi:hypothetical protein|nr:hypothetical protein LBMAG48_18210 [Phycisphaerae bacterium]
MTRITTSLALCALASLAQATTAQASVTYTDATFNNADWGFEVVNVGTPGGANAAQSAGTGNPGSARRVTISTGPNFGDATYAINRFGTTTATRYTASTQGQILSINFSIDARFVTGTFTGQGQGVYAQAKQGNNIYVAGVGVTGSTGNWTTLSASGISAANFIQIAGTTAPIDFSATGAPIRFGFASANSNGGSPYTITVDYDNFNFEVINVPAPNAALLAVAGATIIARRRRSYHRA